jgi:peptide/nickel transport system permease protein
MAKIVAGKLAIALLTLFIMSMLIFGLVEAMPGDAAQIILGQASSPEALQNLRQAMGLNDPGPIRYLRWLRGFMTGELGDSLYMTGMPIQTLLWRKAVNSAFLAAFAILFYVPLSVVLGVVAGINEGKRIDGFITTVGLSLMAIPEYVSGVILSMLFSVWLGWLPVSSAFKMGTNVLQNIPVIILPALSITLVMVGYVLRMQRSSMVAVIRSDYIRTAVLKGLPWAVVIFKHALRNALLPTITVIGMNMGWLVGGLVVVETLFGFPGLGLLLTTAIRTRDLPLIMACTMLVTIVYIVSNLLTDMLYSYLNPRIRYR